MMMSSGVDQLGPQQRHQRQLRGGRIAAGIGDEAGALHLFARDLGQAIGRLALQFRGAVLVAIPFGVGRGVGKAEIGRQIDDLQMIGQPGDDLLRGAVRQPAEHQVEIAPVDLADRDQVRQSLAGQMRKDRGDRLAGLTVGGQGADLGLRVIAQEAQELGPGIAAGPQYPDPNPVSCRHD